MSSQVIILRIKARIIEYDSLLNNHLHSLVLERQEAVLNKIRAIKTIERFNAIEVAKELNSSLTPEQKINPHYCVFENQVRYMRVLNPPEGGIISYAEDITNAAFSKTLDGTSDFLRVYNIKPFVIIWMSDFQLQKFKSINSYDELFIDGTFDIVPSGFSQLYISCYYIIRKQRKGFLCFNVASNYSLYTRISNHNCYYSFRF